MSFFLSAFSLFVIQSLTRGLEYESAYLKRQKSDFHNWCSVSKEKSWCNYKAEMVDKSYSRVQAGCSLSYLPRWSQSCWRVSREFDKCSQLQIYTQTLVCAQVAGVWMTDHNLQSEGMRRERGALSRALMEDFATENSNTTTSCSRHFFRPSYKPVIF